MNSSKVVRRHLSALAGAAALIAFGCIPARADSVSQTVTEIPSVSMTNLSGGTGLTVTVFSLLPTFSDFNSSLGTLVSATLGWSASGTLTATSYTDSFGITGGIFEATGSMSYASTVDTENLSGNGEMSFSISGLEPLSLSSVEGSGTFNEGPFAETFEFEEGTFPYQYFTGSTTNGSFTVTYEYTVPGPPPPPSVPEISSVSYLFTTMTLLAIGLVAANRSKARSRAN